MEGQLFSCAEGGDPACFSRWFVWSALFGVHLVDFLDVSAERVRRSLRALD